MVLAGFGSDWPLVLKLQLEVDDVYAAVPRLLALLRLAEIDLVGLTIVADGGGGALVRVLSPADEPTLTRVSLRAGQIPGVSNLSLTPEGGPAGPNARKGSPQSGGAAWA